MPQGLKSRLLLGWNVRAQARTLQGWTVPLGWFRVGREMESGLLPATRPDQTLRMQPNEKFSWLPQRRVLEQFGGDAGGVGSVAGGQVDGEDDTRSGGRGEAEKPTVGGASGGGAGGAGFAGDRDSAEGCRCGYTVADRVFETGAHRLRGQSLRMSGKLERQP